MEITRTTSPSPVPETSTLIQRYGALMMRLMQLVVGRHLRNRTEASLARMNECQSRLSSLSRRLRELLARIDAGTLPVFRPRKPAQPRQAGESAIRIKPRMGRGFGWLLKEGGPDHHEVVHYRDRIGALLNEPEMIEKLRQAPRQAGRIVRPLCHMLMLETPERFRLPPRQRPARVPKPRAAEVVWTMPWGTPRVASANWPKGCVRPGETVPLRGKRRRKNE